MNNVSSNFSDDEIISKVLKHIGVKEIGKSRIDGSIMINVFLNDYNLNNIRSYFQLAEIYNVAFNPNYNQLNITNGETIAKIVGFSSNKWKEIVNLQKMRKEKLKKIEICQKYS